jgi:hypothetical protein
MMVTVTVAVLGVTVLSLFGHANADEFSLARSGVGVCLPITGRHTALKL